MWSKKCGREVWNLYQNEKNAYKKWQETNKQILWAQDEALDLIMKKLVK